MALTPEEEVRQNFVAFLIGTHGYPAGRLGNEVTVELNDRRLRCDTLIYGHTGEPLCIVEYKAPDVPVTKETFAQVMRYAIALKTRWIMVSNGLKHFCAVQDKETKSWKFLDHIPPYDELTVQ